MRQTRPITIEQVVVASNQPYDKVIGALEARLGSARRKSGRRFGTPLTCCLSPSRAEVPVDSEQTAYVGNKELALVGPNPRWENVTGRNPA